MSPSGAGRVDRVLTFVQMADPQFGQFAFLSGRSPEEIARFRRHAMNVRPVSKVTGFQEETRRFEAAIAATAAAAPRFAIVCGDMVNTAGDPGQVAEVKRIAARLPAVIPLRYVAGNHDACADSEVPDHESLARYRADFGPDFYAFREDDAHFLVLNACVLQHPERAPEELDRQMAWLEQTLREARRAGASHIVAFTHHPLFLADPEEPDEDYPWAPSPPGRAPGYWVVPRSRRMPVVELFRRYGVQATFCGHWHRNHEARDGDMVEVVTGAVGYPLGDDASGIRIVHLTEAGIRHEYRPLHLPGSPF
jgi:serine/threonine-protein phosphatase CPPED1